MGMADWLATWGSKELSSEFQSCVSRGAVALLGPEMGGMQGALARRPQEAAEVNASCKANINAYKP